MAEPGRLELAVVGLEPGEVERLGDDRVALGRDEALVVGQVVRVRVGRLGVAREGVREGRRVEWGPVGRPGVDEGRGREVAGRDVMRLGLEGRGRESELHLARVVVRGRGESVRAVGVRGQMTRPGGGLRRGEDQEREHVRPDEGGFEAQSRARGRS